MDDMSQVLSDNQKIALVTLWLCGIRAIAFQGDDFALCLEGGNFAGNFHFQEAGSILDFSVMGKYMQKFKTYYFKDIIQIFCPEYANALF